VLAVLAPDAFGDFDFILLFFDDLARVSAALYVQVIVHSAQSPAFVVWASACALYHMAVRPEHCGFATIARKESQMVTFLSPSPLSHQHA
jgi:hypothetical protein